MWWKKKPLRLIQTNLREIDAGLDIDRYMESLRSFHTEVIIFNTGGIVANYPSALPFHFKNPHLGRDLVGAVLERCHLEGIRVISRFDFSKVNELLAADNPQWLYRSADGHQVNYNGQVHTCINGPYQQEHALAILGEVIDRYPIDGVFFNMIGYVTYDYSGNDYGLCHCENCRRRFHEYSGRGIPTSRDPEGEVYRIYDRFRRETSAELFERICSFVKKRSPDIALCTYCTKGIDIVRRESNSGLRRPQPEWPYYSSENIARVAGSYPEKAASNAAVHFIDFPFRHAAVNPALTLSRLAQNIAAGGWLDYYVIGTMEEQDDRRCLEDIRHLYRYHALHEKHLSGLTPLSDALLVYPEQNGIYGSHEEFRGWFAMLSEEHLSFNVIDDTVLGEAGETVLDRLTPYKLVVLPDIRQVPAVMLSALETYLSGGGVLITSGRFAAVDGTGREDLQALPSWCSFTRNGVIPRAQGTYLRILPSDKDLLDGPDELDLLPLDSELCECRPLGETEAMLRYIPPCTFGPPEKCYYTRESETPGCLLSQTGAGFHCHLPWQPGSQYYRFPTAGLPDLLCRVLDKACELERRVRLAAPPHIEMHLFCKPDRTQLVVQLLNLSGSLGRAVHAPLPVYNIGLAFDPSIRVKAAHCLSSGREVEHFLRDKEDICFTVPVVRLLETVIVELEHPLTP